MIADLLAKEYGGLKGDDLADKGYNRCVPEIETTIAEPLSVLDGEKRH